MVPCKARLLWSREVAVLYEVDVYVTDTIVVEVDTLDDLVEAVNSRGYVHMTGFRELAGE